MQCFHLSEPVLPDGVLPHGAQEEASNICFIIMWHNVYARLVLVSLFFIFSIITLLLRTPLIHILILTFTLLVGIYSLKFVYNDSRLVGVLGPLVCNMLECIMTKNRFEF